ncbi:MAG: hypothetical protein KC777_25080 [Cyanobacteria bacterium HKST-UBA02]|nr:hypothetical protein [Cyanobacteria bacterium HKST-UBA02]
MKNETLLILIAVPLLVFVVVMSPGLFKFSDVEVNKKPAEVEKKVFDANHPPPEAAGRESTTVYKFVCESDMDYDVEEESQGSNGVWQVRLKVKRARANLSLPITVLLSQRIPNRRADFEDGHAKICERVYVDAHEPAYAACRRVIGREFSGQNKDRDSARKEAVNQARQEVNNQYANAVDAKVKDVFVIYDFYAPNWHESADVLVDKALQEYEVGKPRKLSSIR